MSMSRRDLYAMGEPFGDSATQHKVGGGRIYGGGGSGGGGGGGTSTTIQDVPDWAKPYAKEGLGKAAALTDTEQNPYQQYDGSRQAGFTDLQTKAFGGADNMGPSAAMGTAANMAGTAGLGALNAGANFNPYQTGQFGGQTAQNYMNPYMQNVVDIQQREAQRTADIAGTGRNAQAVKAGAFGGSRQAIMDAEANRNLSTQMGDIQAQGLNQAYNQGQQQFNTEQALGEQSKQFGNSLGMQGFQTALTGAGQLSNIGQQTFGQEMDVNKLQQQYGTQQQAFDQQGKDNDYQDFLNQQRYPYQQLEFMNSMLRGTPMGTVQSMYQPAPSQLSQLAGLGATAYGVSRMAEGGDVKGYAVGGGITGLLNDNQLQERTQMPTVSTLGRMAAQDEMQDRAQMRAGSAMQAPQGDQPTVADEYMMSRGVASLPTGEMDFAGGGILAFAAGASVPGATDANRTFTRFLESIGKTSKDFIDGSPTEKKALRAAFDKATSGPSPSTAGKAAEVAETGTKSLSNRAGKYVGKAARRFGPAAALGAEAVENFGKFKLNTDDNIDTSLSGTVKDYSDGEYGRMLKGLGVGAAEAALDTGSGIAGLVDYALPGQPAQQAYDRLVRGNLDLKPEPGVSKNLETNASDVLRGRSRRESRVPPVDTGEEKGQGGAGQGGAGQGGAGIGAPRAMGKDGFIDMFKTPSDAFSAMRTEQGKVNTSREQAASKSRASLEKDQKEMGEYGTEREAKLKDQEAGLAGLEKRNQSMAFIEAGLAIMSGNSANAFENIGKGALVGTKAYKEGMDKLDAKRTKLDEAFMNLYDIRRGEKVANKKELRAAETAFESAKVDSAQAMANITGEETKTNLTSFSKGVDAYLTSKEKALDRALSERIAEGSNAATLEAAQLRADGKERGYRVQAERSVLAGLKTDFALAAKVRADKTGQVMQDLVQAKYVELGGGQGSSGDSTMDYTTQGQRIK